MNSHLIKQPVITEKTLELARSQNKFTFKVDKKANKNQIKKAIEDLYGVKVISVNTITSYRVRKATGKKRLRTVLAPTKKAVIELKKGDTIDLFDFGESESK